MGSGSPSRIRALRTIGVNTETPRAEAANARHRARVERSAPQSAALATIDGPMMFRMSTLSIVCGCPNPRIHDCTRKTNARKNIQTPRFITARAAARRSPVRRSFDPAESATDVPARNRNSGAPKPATTIAQRNCQAPRASRRVQLSRTCAWIMMRTARPRTQSRYPRRLIASLMLGRCR